MGWSHPHPTPEKTVKRRLQDCDATLASDDGPIFSTVAKLVDALKRSIPEGTQNAERKKEALRLGRELLRGTQVRGEVRLAISLEILPDSDQYVELSTLSLRLWEYRRWKDDTPCRRTFALTTFLTKSRKTAKSFSINRCVRCGRDFMEPTDGTGWQAAYVGVLRIEPLADSVTAQWVTEDCPGRLIADDCRSRATRQNRAPKGKWRDASFGTETALGAILPLLTLPRSPAERAELARKLLRRIAYRWALSEPTNFRRVPV